MGLTVRIKSKDFIDWQLSRKEALKNIDIDFPSGETTLIMGTSGAGKSTLIKCILGKANYNGEVTYNSNKIFKKAVAYIPQHPALNEELTVESTVFWACRFARPKEERKTIAIIAQKYINQVGLSAVKDHPVGKLSGGQKQRVSIAKELVRGKEILIADEIDTGLDYGVARSLIKMLAEVTREEHKTTIIISHNLSNMHFYDRAVVLAKDSNGCGRVAFSGKVSALKSYFSVNDYVNILKRLNAKDEGGNGETDLFVK